MSNTTKPVTQQEFLRSAMQALKLDQDAMCQRMNVSKFTFEKWMRSPESVGNYREMPTHVWAHVREILQHESLKRNKP